MSGKVLIPVIHVVDMGQMLKNLEVAVSNGADGVFLISHGSVSYRKLIKMHNKAIKLYPHFWIGLNFLDLPGKTVFDKIPDSVNGIWVDNGGINDDNIEQAKLISKSIKRSSFKGLYFGGVAFKGQYFKNAKKCASLAVDFMDIVTTSGTMTGKAASLKKIISMKKAIGDESLAVASGITIENVKEYLPYVDYFLVATGISINFHELDPVKVKELSKIVHEY